MPITAKGYFSGGGGMELGLMDAGIDVIQSLDLDRDAVATLQLNGFKNVLHKDIKDIRVLDQEKTDVIVGTYPCTKYSAIADISGTRTGDDLFLHFFRHIAIERPEAYVVENVPGMKKFPVVMEAMTRLPDYYVNVVCPIETENWLPQRRKRLIIIGTKKPFYITHPSQGRRPRIADIIDQEADVEIPDYVQARIDGKYRDRPIIVDADDPKALAPTCVAHYAKDMGTRMVKVGGRVRPFTVREYARLQGFPDWFQFPDKLSAYKIIGNAVPVPMGHWVGQQLNNYFNR
jgi:DNA (cytosine-5)-methyltransferase 1